MSKLCLIVAIPKVCALGGFKTAVATFRVCFGGKWATFYSTIWSHWPLPNFIPPSGHTGHCPIFTSLKLVSSWNVSRGRLNGAKVRHDERNVDDVTVWESSPEWPDLAKFRHFGKISKVFGYLGQIYLVFGKILNQVLLKFYAFVQI